MKSVGSMALAIALLPLAAGMVRAADFKSIGAAPAVLYDAPSAKGRKVFVAPRNMPVEVVLTYAEWSKVRDAGGDLSWVESKLLSPKRYVIVNAPSAKVRTATDEASALVLSADKGVLFELESAAPGWLKIKHRDGQGGYVKVAEVWGE